MYLLGSFQMVTPSLPANKHQYILIFRVQIKSKGFSFHLSNRGHASLHPDLFFPFCTFVCALLHPDLTQVVFSLLYLALL